MSWDEVERRRQANAAREDEANRRRVDAQFARRWKAEERANAKAEAKKQAWASRHWCKKCGFHPTEVYEDTEYIGGGWTGGSTGGPTLDQMEGYSSYEPGRKKIKGYYSPQLHECQGCGHEFCSPGNHIIDLPGDGLRRGYTSGYYCEDCARRAVGI